MLPLQRIQQPAFSKIQGTFDGVRINYVAQSESGESVGSKTSAASGALSGPSAFYAADTSFWRLREQHRDGNT